MLDYVRVINFIIIIILQLVICIVFVVARYKMSYYLMSGT